MAEWLWSVCGGMVTAIPLAVLAEWLYIGYWRRRCGRAERLLAQLRADPACRAGLEYHEALARRQDDV